MSSRTKLIQADSFQRTVLGLPHDVEAIRILNLGVPYVCALTPFFSTNEILALAEVFRHGSCRQHQQNTQRALQQLVTVAPKQRWTRYLALPCIAIAIYQLHAQQLHFVVRGYQPRIKSTIVGPNA